MRVRPWLGTAGFVLAAMSLLVSVLGAGAQTEDVVFTDTSRSPFARQIREGAESGCFSGFPNGTFEPAADVRRQQMAYWLANCGGRAATTTGPWTVLSTDSPGSAHSELMRLTFATPGVEGGRGLLIAMASVTSESETTLEGPHCPCGIGAQLRGPSAAEAVANETLPGGFVGTGLVTTANMALNTMWVVPTGSTVDIVVDVTLYGADLPDAGFFGDLTAIYVPFDGGT